MQVKSGDTVKVHYIGTLADGSEFDSSTGQSPLEFTVGAGQLIPEFESCVIGMMPGESKTIHIGHAQAYGPYHANLEMVVARDRFPEDLTFELNQPLQLMSEDEQTMLVWVQDIGADNVTLNANHPLAGKDLTFAIQLVEIAS